jgi:malonate-semialdehyde dehydrogenase (acetylating)/methylmalonate-semialdehyde dehydrogenase
MQPVPSLIDGAFFISASTELISVTNPANHTQIAPLPCSTQADIARAVSSAKTALTSCSQVPVSERARVMMRYQQLLKENHDQIAELLSSETGKTFADAKGGVWRGIEVVEQGMNVPAMMMGETVGTLARGIDTYRDTQPLGVCLGITAFNFPAMIPLWMFPLAIALVNRHSYGNGTSIFTASGAAARKYQQEVEVGQVGINIPIPVPLPFFSLTGWKNSFYGDLLA